MGRGKSTIITQGVLDRVLGYSRFPSGNIPISDGGLFLGWGRRGGGVEEEEGLFFLGYSTG